MLTCQLLEEDRKGAALLQHENEPLETIHEDIKIVGNNSNNNEKYIK